MFSDIFSIELIQGERTENILIIIVHGDGTKNILIGRGDKTENVLIGTVE